ncbi:MAG: hypothetical protein HQM09_18575 [Candidatus Riflebacteria bacterium]|nr:hypothetical protein [Candidatus Riflebacteria bacterium]
MDLNRLFSLIVALIYLFTMRHGKFDLRILLLPAAGLFFIWFPGLAKQFDQFSVRGKTSPLDPDSPPCLFVAIGWGILLLPVFIIIADYLAR